MKIDKLMVLYSHFQRCFQSHNHPENTHNAAAMILMIYKQADDLSNLLNLDADNLKANLMKDAGNIFDIVHWICR